MKKILSVLLISMLSACMPQKPDSAFYSFAPSDISHPIAENRIIVDVARVKIPEYIDRTQIVTTSDTAVNISNHNRWAEGLSPMIQRRIISDLEAMLPRAIIKNSDFAGKSPNYTVFVEVYKLDGVPGDKISLDAIYTITSDNDNNIRTKNVHYTADTGAEYSDYAAAAGDLVGRLSKSIAADLVKMDK